MLPEGCKIGVIEDDPVMRESLLQRLRLEGCDVVVAQIADDRRAAGDDRLRLVDVDDAAAGAEKAVATESTLVD